MCFFFVTKFPTDRQLLVQTDENSRNIYDSREIVQANKIGQDEVGRDKTEAIVGMIGYGI
jgi:hypothetical protein